MMGAMKNKAPKGFSPEASVIVFLLSMFVIAIIYSMIDHREEPDLTQCPLCHTENYIGDINDPITF